MGGEAELMEHQMGSLVPQGSLGFLVLQRIIMV
jgi:hypothetical protein